MEPLLLLLACVCSIGITLLRNRQQQEKQHGDNGKQLTGMLKVVFVLTIIYLSWLNLDLNGTALPKNTSNARPERMMLVAVVWMMSLRAISLIIWPISEGSIAKSNYRSTDNTINSTKSTDSNSSMPWYQYLVQEWIWYFAFPIIKTPDTTPKVHRNDMASIVPFLKAYLIFALYNSTIVLGKMIVSEMVYLYLTRCSQQVDIRNGSLLSFIMYTSILSMHSISASYIFDIQRIIIQLISGGHLDFLPFNNWPLLASTVTEFWSKRYNMLVHSLLKDSFYKPLRFQLGWNKTLSTMIVFTISGLLHLHVTYACFQERLNEALAFFVIQALAMIFVDPLLLPQKQSMSSSSSTEESTYSIIGNLMTILFMATTLTLYLGTMVYHLPGFIDEQDAWLRPYIGWLDNVQCIRS